MHLSLKIKEDKHKPVSWILLASSFVWFANSLTSFVSHNVTTNPEIAKRLFLASEVLDFIGKFLVITFLYTSISSFIIDIATSSFGASLSVRNGT